VSKAIWPCAIFALAFGAAAATAKPPPKTNELVALGRRSYNIWCAACHGETGAGDGSAAQKLDPRPRSFAKEKFKQGSRVDQIFNTIATGVPGSAMTNFRNLPEQERWGLAYYVLELRAKSKGK